jgi:putative aldouronate transport system substrate-binding protein
MSFANHSVRKTLLMLLVFALLAALVACSGGKKEEATNSPVQSSNSSEPVPSKQEPVTLKLFGAGGSEIPGIQSDPVAKEIEKRLGIKLDTAAFDENKMKLMLADGDLPDIMMVDHKYIKQMIEGNQIIDMDDYLQTSGQDIEKGMSETLEYFRQNMSEGQNKLYFLPIHTGTSKEIGAAAPQYEYSVGFWTRWDLYKELGYPAINSTDDFLNLLAEMQKMYPKTEDGKKVYGVSAYNGGLWPFIIQNAFADGYYNGPGVYVQDVEGKAYELLTDESSTFWNSMRYFFKANQMGLLDPEAFTQQMDQYSAKLDNLQLLSSIANWWTGGGNKKLAAAGNPEAGYAMIPITGTGIYKGGMSPTGWSGKYLAISKNSKHPERAMELLNFLFTPDGSRLVVNGVEGEHWAIVDGKPEMTEETIEASKTMESFGHITGVGKYGNLQGIDDLVVHSGDNGLINLFYSPKIFQTRLTPLDKAYSEYYGGTYPGDALEKLVQEGKITWGAYDTTVQTGLATAPDDIKRIDAKVEELVKTTMPKLILSKNEDEFNKVKTDLMDSLNKIDYAQSKKFWDQNWKEALDKTAVLKK